MYTSRLGLPDLCYLIKVQANSSFLSLSQATSHKIGSYHYVYGLNVSSPANVSAYISKLILDQETENKWYKSNSFEITKAYFCIFDAFSRSDIHVEINIPGQMKLFAFSSEASILSVNDRLWQRGFVSSVLRSMCKVKFYQGKIMEELETREEFEYFFKCLVEVIKSNDLPSSVDEEKEGKVYDRVSALTIVFDYLLLK